MRTLTLLAASAVTPALSYELMGDYMPLNNVLEHSQMSLDVKAFSEAVDAQNYLRAKEIYEKSEGNSCRSPTDGRALGGFNRKHMEGEAFYETFMTAGFAPNFWDAWMLSALDGTGEFAGASHTTRKVSLKGGALGLVSLYVTHVMELGIQKAADPKTRADDASGFFWDMGWAFYYGVGGKNSNFELAKQTDADFPQGLQVHMAIAPHFNKGLVAMRPASYSKAAAVESRDTIYRFWAVTHMRAVLRALLLAEKGDEAAAAEARVLFRAVDGWVHSKSPAAATIFRELLKKVQPGSFCLVKRTLEATYPLMGLNCQLMGNYLHGGDVNCLTCIDTPVYLPSGLPPVPAVPSQAVDVTCKSRAPLYP